MPGFTSHTASHLEKWVASWGGEVKAQNESILIVDDDLLICDYLKTAIEDLGYDVCGCVSTAEEAVQWAQRHRPHLILMDVRLRGRRDGIDAALEIREKQGTPIVFITGSNEPETLARINTQNPAAVLIKPIMWEQLERVLKSLLP